MASRTVTIKIVADASQFWAELEAVKRGVDSLIQSNEAIAKVLSDTIAGQTARPVPPDTGQTTRY